MNGSAHIHITVNFTDRVSRDPISRAVLQTFQVAMTCFWMMICVTGVCTNFLNIRAFLRMGLKDSVTVSFFALAISDFNMCSIAFVEMLSFIAFLLEYALNLWFYLPPLIPTCVLMCLRRIFNTITVLITTFLAVQRCVCVVLPFTVRDMFTRARTVAYLAAIVAFSGTSYGLFLWRHDFVPTLNEAWNATQLKLYIVPDSEPYLTLIEVVIGIGLNVSCQLVVICCLGVMAFSLKKAVQFRHSMTSAPSSSSSSSATAASKAQKANNTDAAERRGEDKEKTSTNPSSTKETQAMIQVALLSVIFVVTNLPYLGYGFLSIAIPEFGVNKFINVYHLTHNIMFTTELLNSSVNFVVYYKYNTKFKSHCFRPLNKKY